MTRVTVKRAKGLDLGRIIREEMFNTAQKCRELWQDGLLTGVGADGVRRPWFHTGEAVNDITVYPTAPIGFDFDVGGDVIQLAVAEFGRSPGSMPPYEPIAEWARLKGLTPQGDSTFEDMVNGIRWKIYQTGIMGFAPGRRAALLVEPTIAPRFKRRINAEIKRLKKQRR